MLVRKFGLQKIKKYALLVLLIQLYSAPLFGTLTCKNVALLTNRYLQYHLSVHRFDAKISEYTIKNFIKNWDPGKLYFLQNDVDELLLKYRLTLPLMIDKGDCTAIDDIFRIYITRFNEQNKNIDRLIDQKHNFKIDEYLNLDRKKITYAKSQEDLNERWRKRIKFQHMQLAETVKKETLVREKLHKRYKLLDKRHKELTSDDVYETFVNSFSTALDPHSEYMSMKQLEDFHIHTRLYLEGIGALLHSEDGITTIHGLVPGGSAQKSGLVKTGDKIVAVTQDKETAVDVIDMDLRDVVDLIRGPRGTKVHLTIRRDDKVFVVTLQRDKVDLPDQATKSRIYTLKEKTKDANPKEYKVGFIDLPSFYMDFEARSAKKKNFRSSTSDMALELEKLKVQKVDLVIVDIRSNGGGALDEAINAAGLFVGSGPVVQVKKGKDRPYVHRYDGKAVYKGPLIVMIDKQSASSSEIMAGAIKDYERGLIIGGEHTFGKGTVQIVDNLEAALGAIKITISKFYRPQGDSTQKLGVPSDINLPSPTDYYDLGEKFYDYALEWDKVASVPHHFFRMTKPYVQQLSDRMQKRVHESTEFKKVFEAIEEYNKNKDEHNRISLKIDNKKKDTKKTSDEDEVSDYYADASKAPKLSDDLHLQETLRIAGDYIRLIKKQELIEFSLVELEKEQLKEAQDKKVAKKPAKKSQTEGKKEDKPTSKPSTEKSEGSTTTKTETGKQEDKLLPKSGLGVEKDENKTTTKNVTTPEVPEGEPAPEVPEGEPAPEAKPSTVEWPL